METEKGQTTLAWNRDVKGPDQPLNSTEKQMDEITVRGKETERNRQSLQETGTEKGSTIPVGSRDGKGPE